MRAERLIPAPNGLSSAIATTFYTGLTDHTLILKIELGGAQWLNPRNITRFKLWQNYGAFLQKLSENLSTPVNYRIFELER